MAEHVRAAAAADAAGYMAPRVSPQAFLGTIWALTTLSLFFLPARFYVQWSTYRHFFWDDFCVVFAWLLSFAISLSTTILHGITYEVMLLGQGHKKFPPNVRTITMQFTRLFNVVPMLLYVGLWSIKLAFLLFFRRLGVRSIPGLRHWWWCVFAVCLLSFFACFATLPYRCCFTTFEVVISKECQTQGWSFISMRVNCALDVFTDCLIMTIPFCLLRKIRISMQQKLALTSIFSLVLITMTFSIIRATVTTFGVKKQIDPTWMYMWSSIELNIALIISCIAPYRSLFLRARSPTPQGIPLRPYHPEHAGAAVTAKASPSCQIEDLRRRGSYVAPWVVNEGLSTTCVEGSGGGGGIEGLALGVLPDESGNWSTLEGERDEEVEMGRV